MWDATLGQPAEIADVLTVAWLRRKRFEAQLQAVEIVNMLGQAMSESANAAASGGAPVRMGGNDAVMRQLGVTF